MNNKLLSILLTVSLVASLGLLGKAGCDRNDLMDMNDQLNKELMQADLDKGRALTKFGDAQSYISQLETDVKEEIESRDGWVTRYAELEFEYKVLEENLKAQETQTIFVKGDTIQIPVEIDLNLTPGALYKATDKKTLARIERLQGEYEDNRLRLFTKVTSTSEGPVFEHSYFLNMGFELQFVESHLPTGAINHYAKMWEIDKSTGERTIEVSIKKFAVVVERPEDKRWYWWAPHLDIGGLGGIAGIPEPILMMGASIGFSFFGYGRTLNDLDWRVLRLSLDLTNETAGAGLTPFVYNIGQHLPLFSNIWIGPHVTYLPPEGWGAGLFLGAML